MPAPDPVIYRERLRTPWWFWAIAVFWALTLGVAYGHAIGRPVGFAVGCAAFSLAGLGLGRVATLVTVTDEGLTAGVAHLPADVIGAVTALDAEAARHQRGQGADSRAFVLLRGWVPTAVRVGVEDRRDPTPYWYVSSRSPERLAEALRQVQGQVQGQGQGQAQGQAPSATSRDHAVTDMTGSPSASTLTHEEGS